MVGCTTKHHIHHNTRLADVHANFGAAAKILRFILQSAVLGVGAYLVVMEQASGGIMIASAIVMGRALAPVEVALTNWKQLVAAREGIGRLRAILKVTAAPAAPAVVLQRPHRSLIGRRPQRCRARYAENSRLPAVVRPEGRKWTGASRCQRGGEIVAREGARRHLAGRDGCCAARRRANRPLGF